MPSRVHPFARVHNPSTHTPMNTLGTRSTEFQIQKIRLWIQPPKQALNRPISMQHADSSKYKHSSPHPPHLSTPLSPSHSLTPPQNPISSSAHCPSYKTVCPGTTSSLIGSINTTAGASSVIRAECPVPLVSVTRIKPCVPPSIIAVWPVNETPRTNVPDKTTLYLTQAY